MGFSSGMAAGAGVVRTAEDIAERRRRSTGGMPSGFTTRPSMPQPTQVVSTKDPEAEALVTAEYQKSRQDLAQVEQQREALESAKGMESARLAKIDIDETRARGEKNATEQQARDFQMSAASLAVGDTSLAEEYINNYGDPRMKISLKAGEGGKIMATPNGGAAPMTFDNARNFYSSFFGQLRPKGSDFALPAAEGQDWSMSIEDGRAYKLDKKSGRHEKIDSWEKPGTDSASGGATSKGVKAAQDVNAANLQQTKNFFINTVLDRLKSSAPTPAEGEAIVKSYLQSTYDEDGKETGKGIKWERIVEQMTPQELEAWNTSMRMADDASPKGPSEEVGMIVRRNAEVATGGRPPTAAGMVTAPPAQATRTATPVDVIEQARAAIKAGKDPQVVAERVEKFYPGLSKEI